jgi:Domain of unknown function (DUF4347)/Tryptophan-rich Synechocystis species C-terminal domain/Putative esterase
MIKTEYQERDASLANHNQIEGVENRNSSANQSICDARDKTELAFVDPNVGHRGVLAKAWRDNVEAIVLEPTRRAEEQICAALESRSDVKAIHILAHGCPGEVGFASGCLSIAVLDRWSPALDKIKASLGANGQMLLWSCSAGAGESGHALVEALSEKISASVFASSGFVGAGDQGGSWNLDFGVDVRPVAPPITSSGIASYPGLLALGWPARKTGVEGNTIALGAITGAAGTVTIGQIPVGSTLIDGSGHSFTASVGNTSISLAGWTLSSLKIVTVNDIDFTLTATTTSGQTAQETVVINPVAPILAPVAETGVEGSPIGLNLGASAKNPAGDSNRLATLTISAIPVGATLSDGVNTFTATTASTSVSVLGWSLPSLAITPLKDANFSLSVSATQMDSQEQLSTATTATEPITANPPPPPSLAVIESSGSMSLLTDGTNYFLQPNGGSAVKLSYAGAPVFAGEFAQYGYNAPIAAAQTASGYEVAWKTTSGDQYQIWTTDSVGNELSIPFVGSGSSTQFESYEASFNHDLNGDGTIGVPPPPSVPPSAPPQFVYEGTDATGAEIYDVTWSSSGLQPFAVRVLTPEHPSADYPHSFLYDLPVEPGLAQSTFGNGLNELAKLDVEDQYNATIIEPIFPIDSWYADNPNDPTINYETFVADILPQWVDSNFSTTGIEKNLLVGFSKSGYGALDLELKHPSVFSAVAAFDFPGDMSSYDEFMSSSASDYGTQANFQDNYELTNSFINASKAPFTTDDRILISEGPVFQGQVADFDSLLTSQGVMHTLLSQTGDAHTWSGGWLSGAIAGLYGLEQNLNSGKSA